MANTLSAAFNKHRIIPFTGLAIILFGMTLPPKSTFGQSGSHKAENIFESILISDDRIADLSAIAWSAMWGEDQLKLMIKIKKESLNIRLKHLEVKSDLLMIRMKNKEKEMAEVLEQLEPTSRQASEQLLIAAYIEFQKISWDLASESELLKEAKENSKQISETAHLESQIAAMELDGMRQEIDAAVSSLEKAEELVKGGAVSTTEAKRAREKVAHLKHAFEVQQLRLMLADRKESAIGESQIAEVQSQVRKLTARKQQIERDIADHTVALKQIAQRERLQSRLAQHEESLATLASLKEDLQSKMDEVNALISALDAIEIKEKGE